MSKTTTILVSTDGEPLKKQGMFKEAWRRLKKSPRAMIGLTLLCLVIAFVVVGPMCINKILVTNQNMNSRFLPSSRTHFLGTDNYGRDVFARIVYGGRTSLLIGFTTALVASMVGGTIGLMLGYHGGTIDNITMRFVDILSSIPVILLALAIVSALGCNVRNLMIAITVAAIPGVVRVVRSAVLNIVGMEYIEAAKAGGTSDFRIMSKHLLPNIMGTVIVQTTMNMAFLLLQATTLSFVGLGIQPPQPEWGAMLSEAREFMRNDPLLMVYPGVCIVVTALSLNLLGDGFRDAFDPRLRT